MSLSAPILKGQLAVTFDSAMNTFFAAEAGDLLVLGAVHEHAPHGIQSVEWNGLSWTRATQAPAGISKASLWYLKVQEDGESNLVVTFTGNVRIASGSVYAVSGSSAAPSDMDAAGFGSGLLPDSGITPQTSQANEVVFGLVMTEGGTDLENDAAGTWLHSMTALERNIAAAVGLQLSIDMAYRMVSAQGQYRAAQTLTSKARPWAALCATFREALLTTMDPPRTPVGVEIARKSLPVESERATAQAIPARQTVQVNDEPA